MALRWDLSAPPARTGVDEACSKEGEMRRLALATLAAMAVSGAVAPAAMGDGGPPISINLGGIHARGGKLAFDALGSGKRTIVLRISRTTDRVVRYRSLPLRGFGIPAVGLYHPTPAGLSADANTLVLQGPTDYSKSPASAFAIVNTKTLGLERIVRLRGTFGFDGLSPDGRRMYLVQYPSPVRDPSHYIVRAYDLRADRLVAKPIVDPADDEQMRGLPVMRAMSPDGRWAYTLYTGPPSEKEPFVHALDLGAGRAKCIDLPRALGTVYNDRLRMTPDGRTLTVVSKQGEGLASVDTRTFDVSTPSAVTTANADGSGEGFPWILIALGGGLMLAAASLWGMPRLHRRRLAGTDD
jgi:hypothetical protein